MKFLKDLIEIFFPFSCHICKSPNDFGKVVCRGCMGVLEKKLSPPFQVTDVIPSFPIWTMGFYNGILADAIKVIKYRPSQKLFRQISELIRSRIGEKAFPFPFQIFVPVPLHPQREQKRGFNQAELIARLLAELLHAHFSPALVRTRATRPQAECDETERQSNLQNAFSLAPGLDPNQFRGKRICLVDDVATTGLTLDECSKSIKILGPESIHSFALAHSPRLDRQYFAID